MNYNLICTAANYTYSGISSVHSIGRTLLCSPGAYTITGSPEVMQIGYILPCSSGMYTYIGQITYLQVLSLTALPPILYSINSTDPQSQNIEYKTPDISSGSFLPIYTTSTTTPTISVDIVGVGSLSTLADAHSLVTRVSDYVILSDINSKNINKVISENTTITDLLVGVISAGKVLSAIVSTSESISTISNKNLPSIISTAESLSKFMSTILSDIVNLSDSLSKNPNNYFNDLGLVYETFNTSIGAQDYILREDGSLVLREDGFYFIRNSIVPTINSDLLSPLEIIGFNVNKNLVSNILNNESVVIQLSKLYNEIIAVTEGIYIESNKVAIDSVTVSDQLSIINDKPIIDSTNSSDLINININKVLSDTQTTNDSISSKIIDKLLAASITPYDNIEFSALNSQTYILREDGSLILREDDSYIIRQEYVIAPYSDYIVGNERVNFNLTKLSLDYYTGSDTMFISTDKLKLDTSSTIENLDFVLTNFILRQDGISYMLREDGSYLIREA